ncbi:MAG: hypothetical protein A2583_08765 [Bdellovibrionales bacterium RIFOXYD1_FULL_53_11]|nr:MAG: hypothetical protein A2583_08765 [Bdellovibrionales bacterium RIFOXYD1_FULL_53_11]
MRILVRAPNWIGDQVLAFPFFYFLRKAFPGAHIASACVPWVEGLQFRNLVDEVITLPRPARAGFFSKLKNMDAGALLARARGPWDFGISLPNSFSAAWFLKRAGALRRRGYGVEGRGILLSEPVGWDPDPDRHRAQAYVDLLAPDFKSRRPVKEFWDQTPANELDDPVKGEMSMFDAVAAWPCDDILEPPKSPYWVLAPGATADSRRWGLERFARLAKIISQQTGLEGVIVGGPAEARASVELSEDPSLRLTDCVAHCPVQGLWKIFGGAKFTVTNESGLSHVAALCGSPVQIVCGAADPKRTRPLGPGRVRVVFNPVDCWPCERNICTEPPAGQLRCLRGIEPDAVWEEIKSVARV